MPIAHCTAFINEIITFVIIAAAVFFVIRAFNRLQKKEEVAVTTRDCPFCFSAIPIKATRCGHCTSTVEGPVVG